jgi:hypothetical protein
MASSSERVTKTIPKIKVANEDRCFKKSRLHNDSAGRFRYWLAKFPVTLYVTSDQVRVSWIIAALI